MQNTAEAIFKANEIFRKNLTLGIGFLMSQGLTERDSVQSMCAIGFTNWFDLEFQMLAATLPEKVDMRVAMHKLMKELTEHRLNQLNVPVKEKK